ncbi:MAG: glycosyltransferase [Gammaproteobacteria bacterium]|nr:glycosyltransferase [Gammaproteobacteria bacterium]
MAALPNPDGHVRDASPRFDLRSSASVRLPVIVNYQTWLPLTENWLHTQLAGLPSFVDPLVVCGRTRSLDALETKDFRYRRASSATGRVNENIVAYDDLGWRERCRLLASMLSGRRRGATRKGALLHAVAGDFAARVVHSHFGYTGYRAASAIRRLGLGHVVSFYGVDMSALPAQMPVWRDRYLTLFEDVDKVLIEGPHMAARLADLGCPEGKLHIHHLGVDLSQLPFRPYPWYADQPLKVLIASSFREKKGIPLALDALARLGAHVPLMVTIVGDAGRDAKAQKERSRIEAAHRRSGLGAQVTFTGYVPHRRLIDLAYRHHIYLAPSCTAEDGDSEGGAPVTLMEMAAAGLLVVSSRHADIPEVIPDGVCGLLADEGDVEGLLGKLLWLAEHRESWFRLRWAARQRIETEFESRGRGRELARIYQHVAGSHAAAG